MKLSFSTLAVLSISLLIGCGADTTAKENNSQTPTTTEPTSQPTENASGQTNTGITYRVGTMDTYPPFATVDEYGKVDGFDIDIIKAIAKERGFNVQFIVHPWEALKPDIVTKKVDIWAAGITIEEYRKEFSSFSDPYMPDSVAILTRDDEPSKMITQESLKNYKVGLEKGSSDIQMAESLMDDPKQIKLFDTSYKIIEALLQKKIDAIVGNETLLVYMSQSFPEYKFKKETIKNKSGIEKQLGFMVQKDKVEVVNELNEGLKAIKANGEFDRIKQKWIGDLTH